MYSKILMLILLIFITFGLAAQDFYDPSSVNTIRLYFTQTNWDQLLDQLFAAGNEGRLLGTAVINGVTYDSVGVRYKGNSSYSSSRLKNPFNIKLNYMIEDQLLDGKYGTIKLANGFSDPTLVRETLSYEIARKYMPASKANYANVYVNDQLIGVYTSVQDVDGYFMQTNLGCVDKPRFKCDTNTMNAVTVWGYLGADSTSYSQYYGIESDSGWAKLINFTNTLNNNSSIIANVLNVDQHLWMCAFDNLLVNLDSPINIFHNFYLFWDANDKVNPILWDLNMSFGGFGQGMTTTTMQNMDPLRNSTSNTFTMLSRVLSNARYKKMYIAHMRTILTENFTNGWYLTRAAELQAICGPSVQADPHFFYTYTNFQNNINTSVSGGSGGPGGGTICGISQLMSTRSTYLQNCSAFSGTVPTITTVNHSPANVVQNSTVHFTLTATNATYAQLCVRQNITDDFTIYAMSDDGNHNDGAVGDGVYGVDVTVGFGELQYYAWAENSSQGVFLPARAAHEYYTLAVNLEPGELYINEIMAQNATYPDSNGDFDDWVEVYNPSDSPVDIGGMYMTDNHYNNGISSWTHIPTNVPDQTTIPAHGFLTVWFDEEPTEGPLHINNKLGASADAVYLIDSDGTTVVDTYSWTETTGLNTADVSIGRNPDGGSTWILFGTGQTLPVTQGTSNTGGVNLPPVITAIQYSPLVTNESSVVTISCQINDADNNFGEALLQWGVGDYTQNSVNMDQQAGVYTASIGPFALNSVIRYRIKATDLLDAITYSHVYQIIIGFQAPVLYINEIMPSNTMTIVDNYNEYEDWVEIYNPTDTVINLAGYYLVDNHYYDVDFIPSPISSAYADSMMIPAHGFKVFWFDEDPEQGVLHIDSKLGSAGDGVYLLAPDMLTVIDSISWGSELTIGADQSYGRSQNGNSQWMIFGLSAEDPVTPGTSNSPTGTDDHTSTALAPVVSIYPNPTHNVLNVDIKNSTGKVEIKVYNIRGQLVKEVVGDAKEKTTLNLDLASNKQITSGIYLVKVVNGKNKWSRKVCIVH